MTSPWVRRTLREAGNRAAVVEAEPTLGDTVPADRYGAKFRRSRCVLRDLPTQGRCQRASGHSGSHATPAGVMFDFGYTGPEWP